MSEPFVRADVRAFLDYMAAAGRPPVQEAGHVAQRELMRATRDLVEPEVGALAVMRDLAAPGPAGPIPLRLFDARADRLPGPVVVFFHGGGFTIGDVDFYTPLCAEIARGLDLPVVSVEYRLAPEHPFPAAPDDCEAAARWVASGAAELGLGVSSLVLAGDSAGGNLTIVTAMALRDAPAAVPVIAQWPIYPVLGRAKDHGSFEQFGQDWFLTIEAMRFFDRCYAADAESWRAAPAIGRFDGLPPALVVTASLDPLRDEGRAYAGVLAGHGIPTVFREAAGTIHGFMTFRRAIPSAAGDLAGCLAALKPIIVEAEADRVMRQAARAG
ncbi:alpha/beta hydrolase [Sphingomonas jatrophae]|uniref:Acetyl esterase n=1 Tax=Sphingomonas jatrophae TaxID=1166337 RepID=A0A1I6M3V9_9SPHN|nr:alpha/beta hydrolase [Sphingomonas jatrophae]SFS10222.1 acetyl esterase [Sphingomonas jatrophae]